MFTGLVEAVGIFERRAGTHGARSAASSKAGARPRLSRAVVKADLGKLELGESIAVNGVCLTVDRIIRGGFEADMSSETLDRTSLGSLAAGCRVHLERATPLGGRMGGHVLLGHVDGIGRVNSREPIADSIRLSVLLSKDLAPFVAAKGSIAIDGVSLTLNGLSDLGDGVLFDVMLVPHTLAKTELGRLRQGSQVNIEVDVLARYVARQLGFGLPGESSAKAPAKSYRPTRTEGPNGDSNERILATLRKSGFV